MGSSGFFAWCGYVRKRQSTDTDVLNHELVREAYDVGYRRGARDRMALEAEFAGAIEVNRRVANLLEELAYERDAVQTVDLEALYADEP